MHTTSMSSEASHAGDHETDHAASRWLVTGDASWADRLQEQLPEQVGDVDLVRVPTLLAAMGSLGHESADVVIGPTTMLKGDLAASVRALRSLAPEARLLVVTQTDEPAEQSLAESAIKAGFDGWLPSPVSRGDLERLLLAPETTEDQVCDEVAGEESPRQGDDGPFGDVDLIDRILSGGSVREVAMRMIQERSRIEGVGLVADESEVPPGHEHARLMLRGREFGYLHAPPEAVGASDADLAGWAGWLSRWLALDEQVTLLKDLSMRDALTDVWNRRYFDRFLRRILSWASRERSQVTLLVFDIDDFKLYNDRYGHSAGDDILRECSKLMLSVVREHDVVARIGGDEFAVIFWDADAPRHPNSRHPEDVVSAATRFQQAICSHQFPKLLDQAPGTLTISGGLASFPWDGRTPQELLDKADEMAMQSKRQGKNAIKFGPGAERVCQTFRSS